LQACNLSLRHCSAFSAPFALTLGAILLMSGCSAQRPSPSNDLVGQWQCVDSPWTLKFTEDGQIGWRNVGPVFGGTYQWTSEGGLEVLLDNGEEYQAGIEIDGNQELTWNGSDGTKGRFRRVHVSSTDTSDVRPPYGISRNRNLGE
jgi:hypothetical protein